jgi:hypothetical protein
LFDLICEIIQLVQCEICWLKRFDEAIKIIGYVPSDLTRNGYYNILLTAYVLNGDDLYGTWRKRMLLWT